MLSPRKEMHTNFLDMTTFHLTALGLNERRHQHLIKLCIISTHGISNFATVRLSPNTSSEITQKSSVSKKNRIVTEVTLHIHNTQIEDNLQIQCIATNAAGKTEASAKLHVNCKYQYHYRQ